MLFKTRDNESFIYDSNIKHNYKFDYTKTNYVNTRTKVTITCKEHGDFEQRPQSHLNGQNGCPYCNNTHQKKSKKDYGLYLESLIEKANKKHDFKYKYIKETLKQFDSYVDIICPEHGNFNQRFDAHLRGQGCSICSNNQKIDTKLFIEKSKIIFNNHYDYIKTNYINNSTKVTIICKEHKTNLNVYPYQHLNGQGCKECNHLYIKKNIDDYNKKITTKEFIEKSKKIFFNKFDYTKTNYINTRTKVTITCKEHGDFEQRVQSHLKGQCGCKKCLGIFDKTQDEFINESKQKHGNKFLYDKVNYINTVTKITLICKEHGKFDTKPKTHLKNDGGCPKCSERGKLNTKDFIKKSKKIHKNKYDYSQTIYVNNTSIVDIICPKHGLFQQQPRTHISGSGCSGCSDSGFNKYKPGILYYILIDGKYYKIGITNKSIKERFTKDFDRIKVIKEWYYDDGEECYNMEQYYLKEFEWAKVNNVNILAKGGNTELFDRDILNLDFN